MGTKTTTATKLTTKGANLPPEWAAQAGVSADEEVEVIIRPDREAAAKRLIESARRMREQAKQRGLTPEALNDILNDR